MQKFGYILLVVLFIAACGTEASHEAIEDKSVLKSETQGADFESFWAIFIQKTADKEFLAENIHFPFMNDVYNKLGSTKEAFDSSDFDISFFNELATRNGSERMTIEPFSEDGYMHYDLKPFLIQQFGNLNNMYILKGEADPSGFAAYFKLVDGQYKFVGYESTQSAD